MQNAVEKEGALEKDICRSHPTYRQRTPEPAITYGHVYALYRQLLHDLALHLTQDNLRSVVYLRMIPEQVSSQGQLEVLRYLDQRGEIVWNRTNSLRTLLHDIKRLDLAHSHLHEYEMTLERYASQEEKKVSTLASGMAKVRVSFYCWLSSQNAFPWGQAEFKVLLWPAHMLNHSTYYTHSSCLCCIRYSHRVCRAPTFCSGRAIFVCNKGYWFGLFYLVLVYLYCWIKFG